MMTQNDNGDNAPPTKPLSPREVNSTRDSAIMISLLREVRTDQMDTRREFRESMRHLNDAVIEQSRSINRLSTDVASLSIRASALESGQKSHGRTLATVKERQDSCGARVIHEDENTEIRKLKTDLLDAIEKDKLRKRQTPLYSRPPRVRSWWGTEAGKAVLLALAGLIVAISTMVGTYQYAKPTEFQRSISEAVEEQARKVREEHPVERRERPVEPVENVVEGESRETDCDPYGASMEF